MGGGKGGKKGGGEPYYVDYRMTVHMGLCHGPVDALLGIYIKERDAWPGTTEYQEDDEDTQEDESEYTLDFTDFVFGLSGGQITPVGNDSRVAYGPGALAVDRPDLFGGKEKEGGVKGEAYWLPGREDQTMPEHLAARYGLTTATMVGYRGLASIYFSQGGDKGGFLWQQNNPYMNTIWATVFRASRGLDQTKQLIQVGSLPPDTNAANIIYEALTNDDWGMCAPDTILDVPSFIQCQATLWDEKFGLSLLWSQQTTVEAFVTEILDHIQATLFVNPATGLLTLKLIRGDYNVADLPHFNPDNCDLTSRSRKAWGETINEVNIGWTNPEREETETVTFQDLANIAMQGGEIVSDTRDYYGIRNKDLAAAVGARDIRTASQPLFAAEMEADREGWKLTPGSCLILDWPEDGLSGMVMRVGKVDYGRPGQMAVKVSLLEDIFSLATAEWESPPVSEWVDTTTDPTPIDYIEVMTIPYAILSRAGIPADDDLYPRVVPAILAASEDYDTNGVKVFGSKVLPNGQTTEGQLAAFAPTARGELAALMPLQAETVMTLQQLGSIAGTYGPELAGFAALGAGGDEEMELIMFDSFDTASGSWTIARGILDTVPRRWPVGTPIWYLKNFGIDTTERLANTEVTYKVTTRTSGGELPLSFATEVTDLLTERPYLPTRPANVSVGGTTIGGGRKTYTTKDPLLVSWANRNRVMEDTIVRRWTDSNITPEDGQTTRIEIVTPQGQIIETHTGLTGTSYLVPFSEEVGEWGIVKVRVLAERDGFVSLQGVEIEVEYRFTGYGNNYGNDYGQNDG